jgi:hypothetical protein
MVGYYEDNNTAWATNFCTELLYQILWNSDIQFSLWNYVTDRGRAVSRGLHKGVVFTSQRTPTWIWTHNIAIHMLLDLRGICAGSLYSWRWRHFGRMSCQCNEFRLMECRLACVLKSCTGETHGVRALAASNVDLYTNLIWAVSFMLRLV